MGLIGLAIELVILVIGLAVTAAIWIVRIVVMLAAAAIALASSRAHQG